MFSSKRLIVLALMSRSLIHFELIFCTWYEVVQLHLCVCVYVDIQLCHHHMLKRLFFPPLNGLGTLVGNQLTINMRAIFFSGFPTMFHWSILMVIPPWLDYCSFVINFETYYPFNICVICSDITCFILILVICVFSPFFLYFLSLILLTRDFSILLIFPKSQLLVCLMFLYCFSVFFFIDFPLNLYYFLVPT